MLAARWWQYVIFEIHKMFLKFRKYETHNSIILFQGLCDFPLWYMHTHHKKQNKNDVLCFERMQKDMIYMFICIHTVGKKSLLKKHVETHVNTRYELTYWELSTYDRIIIDHRSKQGQCYYLLSWGENSLEHRKPAAWPNTVCFNKDG